MLCYKKKYFHDKSSRRMERWHSLWPQNVTGSLEISDLLYDPQGHGDLWGQFDLVCDPKRSQCIWRSPWPTLWSQRSRWPLWSVWPSVDPKGHGVIRGRHDLFYDPKGQLDLWPLPWPTLWPQKVTGSLEVAVTYLLTPKSELDLWPLLWPSLWPKRSRGH